MTQFNTDSALKIAARDKGVTVTLDSTWGVYRIKAGDLPREEVDKGHTKEEHRAARGEVWAIVTRMARLVSDDLNAAEPAPIKLTGRATQAGTIDLTPTWSGLMPGLIAVLENGTPEGKQIAREELTRLAAHVDAVNAETETA